MNIHTGLQAAKMNTGTAVALGYFDGVHLGHRAVMQAALGFATQHALASAAFTFTLPAENYKGKALLTQTEKERRIAALGIDVLLCPPAAEIFGLNCEQFVQQVLVQALHAKAVFCGDDFTFGKNAAGNVALLRTLCAAHGITVQTVPTVLVDGAPVSSTRIRAALGAGEMEQVNTLLGQPYSIDLPVQAGKHFGRTMGLPTINQIYPAHLQLPQSGVYITQTVLDGTPYASATGLGSRPTVGGEGITCETFILGFSGDLYGTAPTVRFYRYLKPTVKFASKEELHAYISSAAQAAKAYFAQQG